MSDANASDTRFLTWLRAAMVVGVALASLSSCDREPILQVTGEPSREAGSAAVSTLTILTWSDYLVPDLLTEFEEANHARIEVREAENSEQLIQALISEPERADVIIVDEKSISQLIELRLLADLNGPGLSQFGNLDEEFLGLYFDPANRYSVPYLWGTTVIAYNRETLPDPVRSWKLLWSEGMEGRISLLDEPDDMFFVSLLAGGFCPEEALAAEIEAATDQLLAGITRQRGEVTDYLSALDSLVSGESDAVVTYSGDAAVRAIDNAKIGILIPEEGAPLWLDNFAVSRDAPNPALARKFIDFMTTPRAAAVSANKLRHGSPNRVARPMIDRAMLENPALYPDPELLRRCRFVRFSPETDNLIQIGMKRYFDELRRAPGSINTGDHDKPGPEGLDSGALKSDGRTDELASRVTQN